jgi:4-hydroxy-3-polyprenylbenzoate decarboxylase
MAFDSFRDWVNALDRAGELTRISPPLATELEITALADREMKSPGGGKALLIEKPTVNGVVSPFPVAINTLGSHRRMALSLGAATVDEAAAELGALMKAKPPTSFKETLKLLGTAMDLRHARPKQVKDGPCQDVVHKFDAPPSRTDPWPTAPEVKESASVIRHSSLLNLPILKCWPLDGGRFLTLPCVVTKDPDTGERNIGMYRVQIYDDRTTGMHWQLQKVGARHGRRYYENGTNACRWPIFLGGDPMFPLRRRHRCRTASMNSCWRATCAEVGGTGEVRDERPGSAGQRRLRDRRVCGSEGTVARRGAVRGPHGIYTLPEPYPVFHVTAVTHRKDAVYPATIVGQPPMEDFYMGGASVKLFLPVFKMNFPEIVDIALPAEGVFHNLVFVSIKKTYPMQAYKIMHGMWGMGQMMFTKYMVVVDDDVDVHNTSEVLFRMCSNTDPQRDSLFTKGPADVLDHATSEIAAGASWALTRPGNFLGKGSNVGGHPSSGWTRR